MIDLPFTTKYQPPFNVGFVLFLVPVRHEAMRMSVMSEERSCCEKVFLIKDRQLDAGFCVVDVAP